MTRLLCLAFGHRWMFTDDHRTGVSRVQCLRCAGVPVWRRTS